MASGISSKLRELRRIQALYGGDVAGRKAALLRPLGRGALPTAAEVRHLHEVLCFLRAYPDDARVLATVERLLAAFDRRRDLRQHGPRLADSGIAGTAITYRFYAPTARWLDQRWGARLRVDWEEFAGEELIRRLLYLLAPYCEMPPPDELPLEVREWVDRLRRADETDGRFLIRRFAGMDLGPSTRDWLFEELDLPIRIEPGPGTPSRTRAKYARVPIRHQRRPLDRSRPSLREAARRPPTAVRFVPPRRASELIDLAREAMVTRSRDLDVFAFGSPDDVRLVDLGEGLQFACIGLLPEQRFVLEGVYGFLTLKNGVPIGYVLVTPLFRSAEIAYNIFDTYRGGEAAYVFGRVVAAARHLFGSDAFTIDPYQLGTGNPEAIESGAWWFYQKLGFRPRDRANLRLMREELRRMKSRPRHRSGIATLKRLAAKNVFFYLGKPRPEVLGVLPLTRVGLRVTGYLAKRFGSDQRAAARTCSSEAATLLGVRPTRRWTPGERRAWERWSPLIQLLPGLKRWSPLDRRALVELVRAKGGKRESEYVLRFDRHGPLRKAILKLIRANPLVG